MVAKMLAILGTMDGTHAFIAAPLVSVTVQNAREQQYSRRKSMTGPSPSLMMQTIVRDAARNTMIACAIDRVRFAGLLMGAACAASISTNKRNGKISGSGMIMMGLAMIGTSKATPREVTNRGLSHLN